MKNCLTCHFLAIEGSQPGSGYFYESLSNEYRSLNKIKNRDLVGNVPVQFKCYKGLWDSHNCNTNELVIKQISTINRKKCTFYIEHNDTADLDSIDKQKIEFDSKREKNFNKFISILAISISIISTIISIFALLKK